MVNGKRQPKSDSRGDGATNSSKRLRVSRACDQCRACREKCDGELRCSTCRSQNRACTYNSQPKKRGIQPNYLRTLELTLAWICQTFPEVEPEVTTGLPRDQHQLSHLLHGKESESAEGLHAAWRGSLICRQIEQLLSGSCIDTNGYQIADYEGGEAGHTEDRHAVAAADRPLSREHSIVQHRTLQNASDMPIMPPADFKSPAHQSVEGRLVHSNVFTLPGNALTLVEYYFAFTHSWLPITEKHSIMKMLYSYPSTGLSRNQLSAPEHAELWSIMALALAQMNGEGCEEFYSMRETAEVLLPKIDAKDSYTVSHLRAMINLALIDAGAGRLLATWLRVEMVVSLLLFFRALTKLDTTDKWIRHLHLATFIVEQAIALRLSIPSHLPTQCAQDIGYVDEDGIDEWAPWINPLDSIRRDSQIRGPARAFSTFNELVRYTMHISQADPMSLIGDGGILFALLGNACLEEGRVQPSILVRQLVTQSQAPETTMRNPADDTSSIVHTAQSGQFNEGASEPQLPDGFAPYPFRDFQHTLDTTPILPSPATVNFNASLADPLTSSPIVQQDTNFGTTSVDNIDSNIFEQLALLERLDSTQHSQFYQNLGFAPDATLAEFFGSDYQPSDPLLAYLNPTLYGVGQVPEAADDDGRAG